MCIYGISLKAVSGCVETVEDSTDGRMKEEVSHAVVKHTKKSNTTKKVRKRGRAADLPPCNICGEKASGLHYGVNSCEACKVFFYRNVKRANMLWCDSKQPCKPQPEFGFNCPACRMKICLENGMSLEGIKKGRYSYERKAYLRRNAGKLQRRSDSGSSTSDSCSSSLSSINDTSVDCPMVKTESQSPVNCFCSTTDTSNCERNFDQNMSDEEMSEIVRTLNDLYSRHCYYPADFSEKVKDVQRSYLEMERKKKELFGRLGKIPIEEFHDIYHKTGIDVDGRVELIASLYPEFEKTCLKYLQYANELPDFDKIGLQDKGSILLGAKSSYWLLADYPFMDVENNLQTYTNYETFSKGEICQHLMSEMFGEMLFSLAKKLQSFNLKSEEVNVLRALVLFNPELCVTSEGKVYTEVHKSKHLKLLKYLLRKNHPSCDQLLQDILSVQKEMVDLSKYDSNIWPLFMAIYNPEKNLNLQIDLPVMKTLYNVPSPHRHM